MNYPDQLDHFAGLVLPAVFAESKRQNSMLYGSTYGEIAETCYGIAKAMIDESRKYAGPSFEVYGGFDP